ncbi:MAG: M20/M25/M40 family metallo-hydrolase, partial [Acidobacteriota bacterium]
AGQGGDGTVVVTGRPFRRNDRSAEGVKKSLPMLSIAPEHYNRIYRILEQGTPVKLEIDIRIKLGGDVEGRNVVGEIPGTDPAGETVMIGAHLDSWTAGTGASDNAAGCAVTLEAMRILQAIGAKPRRTIRMGLWSSEEGGLKGSGGYVRNHFGNPRDGKMPDYDRFSVYFNMDNGTGRFRGVHLQENRPAAPIFEEWMKPFHDLKMKTLSQYSNRGTDHLPFDLAGLPGFQFIQDRLDYRSRTWHYNMDSYDHLAPEDLKINAVIMAGFAYHAAMREEKFPRKPFTDWNPSFTLHQPDLFREAGALTNAVADFDNDGDLDIFVGFSNKPNRLYRNDRGDFQDVAGEVGLADVGVVRTTAWGDYDGDGHMDLFIASVSGQDSWDRLYRNEGNGKRFSDVTASAGVQLSGNFRQATWIDFDSDGDLDLFVALRDKPNVLFRNDGGKFLNVARESGVDDPRRTVGAVWFDYDKDGDLDLYVANMDGDANGLFRNDGGRFVDVAKDLGLDSGGRPLGSALFGSVRPSLADYDNDGNIDIFCANYGPNGLYRNMGGGQFFNTAPSLGLAIDGCYDTGAWGDWDNDGRIDLYVNGTVTRGRSFEDYLFHNDESQFSNVTPEIIRRHDGDHGAQWFDFDNDGDLDLAITGAGSTGMHYLLRNNLAEARAKRSLQVVVLDAGGRHAKAGSEVRIYDSKTKKLLGANLVDTGSGYDSQNAMPVHFGLPKEGPVDVEITSMTKKGRKSVRRAEVDPGISVGRYLVVKIDREGMISK